MHSGFKSSNFARLGSSVLIVLFLLVMLNYGVKSCNKEWRDDRAKAKLNKQKKKAEVVKKGIRQKARKIEKNIEEIKHTPDITEREKADKILEQLIDGI